VIFKKTLFYFDKSEVLNILILKKLIYQSYISTPLGFLRILSNGNAITEIKFQDTDGPEDPDEHTESARTQLHEYFDGKRGQFQLNLEPDGTEFEHKVWEFLAEIPCGSTSSYGTIAAKIGANGAAQAVGAANGKNPIAIVIPCHRVVAANNKLTGYAGGLYRKEWLLKHEGALLL
jgi:methylated-DNA-[protein]-cysteine S-methyltransferase